MTLDMVIQSLNLVQSFSSSTLPRPLLPNPQKQLPQNRKQYPLQPIRNDPRLKPSSKKTQSPILPNHLPCSLRIRNARVIDLPIRLDDPQRIRNSVRRD